MRVAAAQRQSPASARAREAVLEEVREAGVDGSSSVATRFRDQLAANAHSSLHLRSVRLRLSLTSWHLALKDE
jgi:hypothetical protein